MKQVDPEAQALAEKIFELARDGDAARLGAYIEAGVPVNLTNSKGDTLLILAAYHVRPDAVRRLIDLGADPDRVNDRGQTALASAVVRGSAEIVRALLDAGADPSAGNRTAAEIAQFFELDEMLEVLEELGAGPRPFD